MRFLFRWQHVDSVSKPTGPDGLREIVTMLDGFEAAAGAWERSVLPIRMETYDPAMLDMLCLAGEVGWRRLSVPAPEPAVRPRLVSGTPIALFLREHADAWQTLASPAGPHAMLTPSARRVLDTLAARGASFFNDLTAACGLDAGELRDAIAALVAAGLVTSDGFSGLRALIWAWRGIPPKNDRRAHFAGRWSAVPASPATSQDGRQRAVETEAWALLRRYGVMFRRLLVREANASPWRELTRVYRRLEARGEIRGGRFVTGMSGEQFALPEAVARLRDVRRAPATGALITISAADPLNLAGILTAGDRIRTFRRNRIVYRDGVPLAVLEGNVVRELSPIPAAIAAEVSHALSRLHQPALVRR